MNLYKFEQLEQFLDKLGAPAAQGRAFQVIERVLNTSLKSKEVEIKPKGIFCTIDGYEHQGYIFNQKPDIAQYKSLPKFHIADCDVVQNRKNLHGDYIWTNSEKVQLYDRGQLGAPAYPAKDELTVLQLCNNCRKMVAGQLGTFLTTEVFHKYLLEQYEAAKPAVPIITDVYGYTMDFATISRRFRKECNYTCERCQRVLSSGYCRQCLHVHHRNGIKTDNRLSNLECLCIRCHAEVDQRHSQNFASRINKRKLDECNRRCL